MISCALGFPCQPVAHIQQPFAQRVIHALAASAGEDVAYVSGANPNADRDLGLVFPVGFDLVDYVCPVHAL